MTEPNATEIMRSALEDILIQDTGVVEGSSDKPVLCYGICAGIAKKVIEMPREETLRRVREKLGYK